MREPIGQSGLLRRTIWSLGIFTTALVVGTIGAMPVFVLGLVVHGFVSWPLSLGFSALLAALAASWAGNLLALDHTRSRLVKIVVATEATAVAIITTTIIVLLSLAEKLPGLPLLILYASLLAIPISATLATQRYREAQRNLTRDALITLGLLVVAILVVTLSVYAASLVGLVEP